MGAANSACQCFGNDTDEPPSPKTPKYTQVSKRSQFNKFRADTSPNFTNGERTPFSKGQNFQDAGDFSDFDAREAKRRIHEDAHSAHIDDFNIIKLIGQGSFGRVFLVQKKLTKKFYALKAMKKKDLVQKNFLQSFLNEKKIMKELEHPYVVNLRFSFQSETKAYLVTDYCSGGDLSHWIKKKGRFDENIVRFYAAEIILALQYLHEKLNIIHRDIKPENILITYDGHIKITDFGLSKTCVNTVTLCGTPDYLAPEVILGRPYGPVIDYWSLGCLMFRMLTGHSTFGIGRRKDKLIQSILKDDVKIPEEFSAELKDLLIGLLSKDPRTRLGYRGAEEIKKHAFFKDIDWQAISRKETLSPLKKETLRNDLDPKNLSKDSPDKSPMGGVTPFTPRDFTTTTTEQMNQSNQSTGAPEHFNLSQFSYTAKDITADCSREYRSVKE